MLDAFQPARAGRSPFSSFRHSVIAECRASQGASRMPPLFPARALSVSIDRPPGEVYRFVANPANLPRWATAFCRSVRQEADGWTVETPQGRVGIRFAAPNDWGVLDHFVALSPEVEVYVPMRVVPNGSGSEVLFTLFRPPEMSAERHAEDVRMVERDLQTLKGVLEN
jgi:uncharacterized protein YndB with AHSA1/START domain